MNPRMLRSFFSSAAIAALTALPAVAVPSSPTKPATPTVKPAKPPVPAAPKMPEAPTAPATPADLSAPMSTPQPPAMEPMPMPGADKLTTPTTSAAPSKTIVDVAAANGSFKTLLSAVKAADLAEILSSEGPYTVFAPTDAAFDALPKGTLEALLKPENKEKLKKILTYHVVSGAVDSKAIKPGQVKTVEGAAVTLRTTGKTVMVNNAKVTTADIKASNGVIHVIDKVILPPNL